MSDYDAWFHIYDSSHVSDIDARAPYLKETSRDGKTWGFPRESTGEFLRIEMTQALFADLTVAIRDEVVVMQSPHPTGGLIRYTPIHRPRGAAT